MTAIFFQYLPEAGLFDATFTPNDWTFVVIIFLAWNIRMYMERKNKTVTSPNFDDYVITLIISYAVTGSIYQLCITKEWPMGIIMFPLLIVAVLSLSIIRWLFSTQGVEAFGGIMQGAISYLNKFFPNGKP